MVTRIPLTVLFILGIPVYVAARVILLVLAFVTLRSLPPAAYETVQWTSFHTTYLVVDVLAKFCTFPCILT